MNDIPQQIWASPVFSGKTDAGEKIVLYKERGKEDEFHLRLPDGGLWVLSPGSELIWTINPMSDLHYLKVVSPEWSGSAIGSWEEVISEEALRR